MPTPTGVKLSEINVVTSNEGTVLLEVSHRETETSEWETRTLSLPLSFFHQTPQSVVDELDELLGIDTSTWSDALSSIVDVLNADAVGVLTLDSDGNLSVSTLPTKAAWALDKVDNTADADKPVSQATRTAINDAVKELLKATDLTTALSKVVTKEAIADDLTTTQPDKVLSARQGKLLKDQMDALNAVFGDDMDVDELSQLIQTLIDNKDALEKIQIDHVEGLRDLLDTLQAEGGETEAHLDVLNTAVSALENKVSALEQQEEEGVDPVEKLNAINQRLDDTDETLEQQDTRLKVLQQRVKALEDAAPEDLSETLSELRQRLDGLEQGSGGGSGDTVDTDALSTRLDDVENALADYVKNVAGKGLSTHDFTTTFRDALQDLIDNPPTGGGEGGTQGPPGTDGADGKDGRNGEQGPPGKDGADGKDGEDGKSAYELAKTEGYSGSLQEWLESLKGADGQDGRDGQDGTSGTGDGGTRGDTAKGFVHKRFDLTTNGLEALVRLIAFGTQEEIDQVTVSLESNGSTYVIGNKPDGLILYSTSISYEDGVNGNSYFELRYPDNWESRDVYDMDIPTLLYFGSGQNIAIIQPSVTIGYTNDRNGTGILTKTGIIAGRGYQWRIQFI